MLSTVIANQENLMNAADQKHLDDAVAKMEALVDKWIAEKAGSAEPTANLSALDALATKMDSLDATLSPAAETPAPAPDGGSPSGVAVGTPMPAEPAAPVAQI